MVCLTPANRSIMVFYPSHALVGYHPGPLYLWHHTGYLWRNGKSPKCPYITYSIGIYNLSDVSGDPRAHVGILHPRKKTSWAP